MAFIGIRIQRDRAFEFGDRVVLSTGGRQRKAVRGMCFGKVGIKRQRLGAGREQRLERDFRTVPCMQSRIAIGDPGISARIVGIEINRPGEEAPRELQGSFGARVEKLAPSEIVGIRLDIRGRRLFYRLLLFRQQRDLELVDDGVCDLVLDGENVGEVAVIAVGPEMCPVFKSMSCALMRTR